MTFSRLAIFNRLQRAAKSDALVLKVVRFGMVGVGSGLVFAAVTTAATTLGGIDSKLASALGYLASVPLNFLGNRQFSFKSSNALSGDILRFAFAHIFNILLTMALMGISVDVLNLHYSIGIVAAVTLVPFINFVFMNWWVFRSASKE